jgi:hypothetical protein
VADRLGTRRDDLVAVGRAGVAPSRLTVKIGAPTVEEGDLDRLSSQ